MHPRLCLVVVAKQNNEDPVILTCSTSADRAVTWTFDGDVVNDFEGKVRLRGQDLRVSFVEEPMLGNYSCWSGGELLSSLFLLLEDGEGGELGEIIMFHFSFLPSLRVNVRNLSTDN